MRAGRRFSEVFGGFAYRFDGMHDDVHPYMDYLFLLTQEYELIVVNFGRWISDPVTELDDSYNHSTALFGNDMLW